MIHAIDLLVVSSVHDWAVSPITDMAASITAAGSVSLVLLFIFGLYEIGHRREAGVLLFGTTLTGILTTVLKYVISRPRPDIGSAYLTYTSTPSFPSGHTSMAFMAAVVLAHQYPHATRFFYGLAATIGMTRIILGVHYPTDVLAGVMVGTTLGYLTVRAVASGRIDALLPPKN